MTSESKTNNDNCPVCLECIVMRESPWTCDHQLCHGCWGDMKRMSNSGNGSRCPMCRANENQEPLCKSCGRSGHKTRANRDCPNNPLNRAMVRINELERDLDECREYDRITMRKHFIERQKLERENTNLAYAVSTLEERVRELEKNSKFKFSGEIDKVAKNLVETLAIVRNLQ